ncbi:MAG: hypothetical protein H6706_04485 [Myxococcales bacterium]|nr:hypothetical protein [Myxococcales bacterium]
MIRFATEIPLHAALQPRDLLQHARTWLVGSQHHAVTEEDMRWPLDGELVEEVVHGTRVVATQLTEPDGSARVGFRYSYVDKERREWTGELVGHLAGDQSTCAVRVRVESMDVLPHLPDPKVPYVIRSLIREAAGTDGELALQDRPHELVEHQLPVAARLLLGQAGNRLPVVYLSQDARGVVLDPERLARFLAGLAHVVVEPSRSFAARLREPTYGLNPDGGTVGIFWPDHSAARVILRPRDYRDADQMGRDLRFRIRKALLNRRPLRETTWQAIDRALIARRHLAAVAEETQRTAEEWMQDYAQAEQAWDRDQAESDAEIRRLEAEVGRLRQQIATSDGLLTDIDEEDAYPNERKHQLLLALRRSLGNLEPDSRRQHIVLAVLKRHDEKGQLEPELRAKEIKQIFPKGFRGLGGRDRSRLSQLGFSMVPGGSHEKLIFQGDQRYVFTVAGTPSDQRTGLNTAADIIRHVF